MLELYESHVTSLAWCPRLAATPSAQRRALSHTGKRTDRSVWHSPRIRAAEVLPKGIGGTHGQDVVGHGHPRLELEQLVDRELVIARVLPNHVKRRQHRCLLRHPADRQRLSR